MRTLRTTAFALLALAGTAHAGAVIDLGIAANYSAFIFGDIKASNDLEGRVAVGGNFTGSGSIGYRAPSGTTGPALTVGGNIAMRSGTLFAGPKNVADTTAGTYTFWGPNNTLPFNPMDHGTSYAVYGGSKAGSANYLDIRKANIGDYVDFQSAQKYLTDLSTTLASKATTGTIGGTAIAPTLKGGTTTGTGPQLHVFNLTLGNNWQNQAALSEPSLSDVSQDSWVLINILNSGNVNLSVSTGQLALMQELNGRVVFNLPNATNVNVGWVSGSILAPKANFSGTGHVEGTVIGQSISQAFEIGWEPPKPDASVKPVPEPASALLAGTALLLMASLRRRRQ